jgi:predicted GNAT superfamily acetyltransferase
VASLGQYRPIVLFAIENDGAGVGLPFGLDGCGHYYLFSSYNASTNGRDMYLCRRVGFKVVWSGLTKEKGKQCQNHTSTPLAVLKNSAEGQSNS